MTTFTLIPFGKVPFGDSIHWLALSVGLVGGVFKRRDSIMDTKEDWENVLYKMDTEGISYTFMDYSQFDEMEDVEFHARREAFIIETKKFMEFLEAKRTKFDIGTF